jgi:hypothetical protein
VSVIGVRAVWHMDHNATRTSGLFTTPDAPLSGYAVVGPR